MEVEEAPEGRQPSTLPEVSSESLARLQGRGRPLGAASPVRLKFVRRSGDEHPEGGRHHPVSAKRTEGVAEVTEERKSPVSRREGGVMGFYEETRRLMG